jgi:CBS domain containing-hemolysin-like protein
MIAGLAAVLILDLFLTAARSALLNATLTRLLSLRDSREKGVPQAIAILTSASYPRAALHLALVLARFGLAGLLLGELLISGQGNPAVLSSALLAFGLALAWLEWVIEDRGMQRPEDWIVRLAPFIRAITFVFYPLLSITLRMLFPRQITEPGPGSVTEDELKIMVDAGQQEGVLEQEEREMIYSIFRLGDTLAREIMIPRIDITALEVHTPIDEASEHMLRTGFSRAPVYEETVDHIQGLLYTRDLLKVTREGTQNRSLREVLRPAYFVPEAKKVDELLSEMQSQRIHMAMVVDEYGGIAGLVTLEDIVEEIVGEIQDEYDQAEELPYQQVSEGEYVFQGRVDLDDFNEILGSRLPKEEADTLGGFIYNRIGRVPVAQETIQMDDLLLTVEQVTGRRIRKVRAQRIPAASNTLEDLKKEESDVDR